MKINKDGKKVGEITVLSNSIKYSTDDDSLLEVLNWLKKNPVPLIQGDIIGGMAYTEVKYISLGSTNYFVALEEFLQSYDYEIVKDE